MRVHSYIDMGKSTWLITKCVRYLIQLVGVWMTKKNNHPTEIGNACLHSGVQVSYGDRVHKNSYSGVPISLIRQECVL